MDRNQLLFAMGVIKGMLASATDEDVKMSLNVSLEFIAKALQGYEMVKPEELQHPVEPDHPEELREPEPVYANNGELTEAKPEETVEDYLPKEIDKEDE
jgi:hypothetical protein